MGLRYFHKHLLAGFLISVITLMPGAGAMFYLGREIRDWQKGGIYPTGNPRNPGAWDRKGLLWPFVPLMVWHGLFMWWAIPILWPVLLKDVGRVF